jgi:uncharacterized protein DUF5658
MLASRTRCNESRWSAAALCTMLMVGLTVLPQGLAQDFGQFEPPLHRGRGSGPPFPGGPREGESSDAAVNRGFVFLEGEYISPPYDIRGTEEGVSINGRELKCLLPESDPGPRGFGPSPSRNGGRWRRLPWELRAQLGIDGVVLAFADQPLVMFDRGSAYSLFKGMTGDSQEVRRVSLVDRLPPNFNQDLWREWIREYRPTEELRARAAPLIASYDASERLAMAAVAATHRLNTLAYPLTLGGMIVAVLAIGHLLGGRPHAGKSTFGEDATPEAIGALNWTLLLVAVLSSLDLVWTVLAAQAGQMRELNPLGSHLIEDPRSLMGFKVGITFPSIAVLWLLRRYKRAQVAAWWICLILTVLAFRWLTFNSMMLSA